VRAAASHAPAHFIAKIEPGPSKTSGLKVSLALGVRLLQDTRQVIPLDAATIDQLRFAVARQKRVYPDRTLLDFSAARGYIGVRRKLWFDALQVALNECFLVGYRNAARLQAGLGRHTRLWDAGPGTNAAQRSIGRDFHVLFLPPSKVLCADHCAANNQSEYAHPVIAAGPTHIQPAAITRLQIGVGVRNGAPQRYTHSNGPRDESVTVNRFFPSSCFVIQQKQGFQNYRFADFTGSPKKRVQ
jgi:hypothetical protein